MENYLSSKKAVIHSIDQLTQKRDHLLLIRSFKNFKDCSIMFFGTDPQGVSKFNVLRNDHLPFYLADEFKNIIEDAIETYNFDIASLTLHLKNI